MNFFALFFRLSSSFGEERGSVFAVGSPITTIVHVPLFVSVFLTTKLKGRDKLTRVVVV